MNVNVAKYLISSNHINESCVPAGAPSCILITQFVNVEDTEAVVRTCSVKKGVLRNFTKFTGKHLCQGLFFNKAAGLRPDNRIR